jgi:hypothetical protein
MKDICVQGAQDMKVRANDCVRCVCVSVPEGVSHKTQLMPSHHHPSASSKKAAAGELTIFETSPALFCLDGLSSSQFTFSTFFFFFFFSQPT